MKRTTVLPLCRAKKRATTVVVLTKSTTLGVVQTKRMTAPLGCVLQCVAVVQTKRKTGPLLCRLACRSLQMIALAVNEAAPHYPVGP